MKKLPIGIQTFEKLRKDSEEYVYVDKTKQIYDLVSLGSVYFFSRPRRFGKSLLCSTLQALFEGKKELFKNLWIEKSDWKWEKHPVIHLNIAGIACSTSEELKDGLHEEIEANAEKHGVDLGTIKTLPGKFKKLVRTLAQENHVAIIVDEYDYPILGHITNEQSAKEIREVLSSFYGVIKNLDKYLRFVFVTGVSKFSMTSIFSKLNHLKDISMDYRADDLCGYTQEELEGCFPDWISFVEKKIGLKKNALLAKVKNWYDGYKFCEDGAFVYNPFSILLFLDSQKFENFWFRSGTPTFLMKLIRAKKYPVQNLEKIKATSNELGTFDVGKIPLKTVLFQAGYLTIKDYQEELYTLGYPNKEVASSWMSYLMDELIHVEESEFKGILNELGKALKYDDIDCFCNTLRSFFSGISYELIERPIEKTFSLAFYILMKAVSADIYSEERTNVGRIDAVVVTEQKIYIFEMKHNKIPEEALKQIRDKKYFEKYQLIGKPIVFVGLNVNSDEKNIDTNWVVEHI